MVADTTKTRRAVHHPRQARAHPRIIFQNRNGNAHTTQNIRLLQPPAGTISPEKDFGGFIARLYRMFSSAPIAITGDASGLIVAVISTRVPCPAVSPWIS